MSFSTNFNVHQPTLSNNYDNYIDNKCAEGDSVMSQGISVLYKFMMLFTDLAQGKYDQMSAQADRSRASQQAANEVDAQIANIAKAEDTANLPQDVIDYCRQHHIAITVQNNGQNSVSDIDAYLRSIGHPDGKGLNKGQLDVVKSALETDSGKCSDFVTQAQLQIQKTMQSYNVCVSLINSMQTMLAEMNKSIAANIR